MRKGLVVGIIVLFLGIAFASSFNAISINNEKIEGDETTGRFTLYIQTMSKIWLPPRPVSFIKVTLESKDGSVNKHTRTNWVGRGFIFGLPEEKEYIVYGSSMGWKQHEVLWRGKDEVWIYMIPKESRTIENPIFNHFSKVEHEAESVLNDKPLEDDYKEIISTVRGNGQGASWNYEKSGWFVTYDLRLYNGLYYINSFTRNPLKLFYHVKAKSIHIKTIIGFFFVFEKNYHSVTGIAIGDITWESYE